MNLKEFLLNSKCNICDKIVPIISNEHKILENNILEIRRYFDYIHYDIETGKLIKNDSYSYFNKKYFMHKICCDFEYHYELYLSDEISISLTKIQTSPFCERMIVIAHIDGNWEYRTLMNNKGWNSFIKIKIKNIDCSTVSPKYICEKMDKLLMLI